MTATTVPGGREVGRTSALTALGKVPRWGWAVAILFVWIVLWYFLEGRNTLVLPGREHTDTHQTLTDFRDWVILNRDNPLIQLTSNIGELIRNVVDFFERLLSKPNLPRPVPEIGWLGVAALATWGAWAIATWRIALLVALSFVSFGLLGYWEDSIDLLIVTFLAVLVTVVVGIPVAIWIANSSRAESAVRVVLDLMQTMPTFVYLLPIVLFFGIGASGAVVCTLVYALPPIIRISGHGIRSVSPTAIEATDSVGQSPGQRLRKVQLPMARPTIIVGLNQTIMAALSMATIASFVDGPGLGQPVLDGLKINDVGQAFVPGLLIVVIAIMLDRTVTAASERAENVARRGGENVRRRRILLAVTGVAALVLVYVSRTYLWAAEFPANGLGDRLANWADDTANWVTSTFEPLTSGFKDFITIWVLNPLQSLLADSPWWLTGLAIAALALALGGMRALVPTVVCLAGIYFLDLWHDAMITLNMTIVGTVLVMIFAVVFGVLMARSRRTDLGLRPLLDAGQTIPPFVYLIPVLALFGPSRFTAIVAGVIYAAPAAVKLVADGVKAVPPTTIEASRSSGSTTRQEITKVQLPMAQSSLVLAANQGLLYVLAMAVIGGMVGAGALGYDVVLGFSRSEEWGKGMAAGITIVLLGIMLDRIARATAATDRQRSRS
jgi:glycine betaine/proline transport system permease protein